MQWPCMVWWNAEFSPKRLLHRLRDVYLVKTTHNTIAIGCVNAHAYDDGYCTAQAREMWTSRRHASAHRMPGKLTATELLACRTSEDYGVACWTFVGKSSVLIVGRGLGSSAHWGSEDEILSCLRAVDLQRMVRRRNSNVWSSSGGYGTACMSKTTRLVTSDSTKFSLTNCQRRYVSEWDKWRFWLSCAVTTTYTWSRGFVLGPGKIPARISRLTDSRKVQLSGRASGDMDPRSKAAIRVGFVVAVFFGCVVVNISSYFIFLVVLFVFSLPFSDSVF
jgi:hypothetical protein